MNLSKPDPDTDLIQAFTGKKDPRAFDALFEKYKDDVYNYCYRFTGNEADAMDCTQETFIKVFRNLPGFRQRSRFSTWLYRIMVNTCHDMTRPGKIRQMVRPIEKVNGEIMRSETEAFFDPEKALALKELNHAFQHALDELNKDQRAVIILRDIEGRSYEEIATINKMKIGTVRSTLARARYRMADQLKDYKNGL